MQTKATYQTATRCMFITIFVLCLLRDLGII